MGQTASLVNLVTRNNNCQWIYRFLANPGMPTGGILPPTPALGPESALGARPRVAVSSAQGARQNLDVILSPGGGRTLGLLPMATELKSSVVRLWKDDQYEKTFFPLLFPRRNTQWEVIEERFERGWQPAPLK
jgi:hypothetical protein